MPEYHFNGSSMPIYVLGTGLSHDGSTVLLKDGKVCVGIEKERLSRRKHDGGNDSLAMQYCLDAEGITLDDVSLVVQCANFEVPSKDQYLGKRLLAERSELPLVSISHHLAHAYSAIGTCPFETCNVMVIDGCGSPFKQCTDIVKGSLADPSVSQTGTMHCEKDSFYHYDGGKLKPLYKDFSGMFMGQAQNTIRLATTEHSIGGFYSAVSNYIFGNMNDAGKLMGLAPFGRRGKFKEKALDVVNGQLFLLDGWNRHLTSPSTSHETFRRDFQDYADIALWAQSEVEKAVMRCFQERARLHPHNNWCYSGGVALNAAANALLVKSPEIGDLFIEPAAGDNGIALGCAFYGWLEVLKKPRVPHDGSTCFGRNYEEREVSTALKTLLNGSFAPLYIQNNRDLLKTTARHLAAGKVVGWFQEGSEFGPRALGRRSILGNPKTPGLQGHINQNIKFREDFRPFAPSVLREDIATYFRNGHESPYMILLDEVLPLFRNELANVVHVDGTARVQGVNPDWNPRYYGLLQAFKEITGLGILLNTSFNKKGTPIVETPQEAIDLFCNSAMDVLVMGNWVVAKN